MTENFFPDDEPQFAPTPPSPTGMVKNFFPEEGEPDMLPVEKPRKPVVPGVLANNEDDPGWLSAAKGTGTAVIKGLANIPGQYKNDANFVDYLMARAHSAITGRPLEEVQRDLQQRYATASKGASGLTGGWFKAPEAVLPSGEDIAAPVLQKTGEYEPSSGWGKAGMAGVETAVGMIGPGGGARSVTTPVKATGLVPRIVETAVTPAVKAAPINVAAGAGAQAATDATGDPLYGLAVGAGLPAVASVPGKIVRPLAKPFTQSGRETGVGEQILKASENPEALRQKLEQAGGNTQTIPGSQPTLAQWVGKDQGLNNAEMAARNEAGAAGPNDPFAAVDKAQNKARLDALEQTAPAGADTMKPSEIFQAHLDHIDQSTEQAVNQLTQNAQAAVPRGALTPEGAGGVLRTAIESAKAAAKEVRNRLYDAIDPDGKLNAVATPARDTTNQVVDSIGKYTPPIENAALKDRILPRMQGMSDVMSLRDLGEIEKDVTNVMSKERKANGDSPDYKRLTQLKGSLRDAINNAIDNQQKYEAAAVARGEMQPQDTMEARLRQAWGVPDGQVQSGRQRSNAATASARAGTGAERPAGEGTPFSTSSSGADSQAGRGLSASAGDQGVSAQAGLTKETPNVEGATGSTTGAGQTPQDKAKALEARRQALAEAGVKTVPRGGELYTDTRGRGIQYHGTSEPNLKPTSEHYSTKNYYGQGFYTTDAAHDIAYGYSKKGSEATGGRHLYEVKENRPLKIADGEAPLQGDVGTLVSELGKRFDKNPYSTLDGVLADAIDEKPKNLRELYDNIREIGTSEGFSADTVQEVFDSVNEGLRQLGYNGLSHTGGQRTGNTPHKVVIYFNPEHDISVNRTSFNQGRVETPTSPAAQSQGLTPNLDTAAIDRVNAAKASATEYGKTYKSEPVAGALKGPFKGQYNTLAGALPGEAFAKGDKGYEAAGAFLKASNDSPDAIAALKDHARSVIAKGAVRPDGTLDPVKYNKLRSDYDGAFRAIEERSPGFTQEFRDAAQATDQVLAAQAARKQQLDDFQKSQASAFLGKKTPTEVENTVGQILQKKDISSIEALIKQASKDPAAIDGLRKAGIDWMVKEFTDTSADKWVKSAKFRDFVNDRYDALARLYPTDQANMFRAIAADLASAERPSKATAPKRGPGTAKDISPFLKKTVEAAQKHSSMMNAAIAGIMLGAHHGFWHAAAMGAGSAALYGVNTLRSAGIKSMKDMFHDALSNPERARYYISKVPQEHAMSAVTRSLRRELLLSQPIGADQPVGRASGGRVNTRDYPAKKASHIEKQMNRICKAYGGELNPMLGTSDDTVARALRVANRQ